MARDDGLHKWFGAIAPLLPGDHIHYVAPSNRSPAGQATGDRLAQIDKANAKRARKAERNRRLAQP